MHVCGGFGGVEPADANASLTALLAHPHQLRVIQAFATIEDRAVRRSLMMLTEDVARLAEHGKRSRRRS